MIISGLAKSPSGLIRQVLAPYSQTREPEARMAKMIKKAELPRKSCAQCGLPIVWRKKWARDWEAVRFCSDRCRSDAKRAGRA